MGFFFIEWRQRCEVAFKGVCQYGFSDVYMDSSIKLTVSHFQTKKCKIQNANFSSPNQLRLCNFGVLTIQAIFVLFRENSLILKYFRTLLIENSSICKEYFVQLYKEEIYKHIVLTTNYLLSFILHLPIAMLVYLHCLY